MAGSEKDCRRVWSVGAKTSSGSRELATAFGLPGQVCCVGQEACRRSVVCRVKIGEWVKGIVGGVWSGGSSMASGSRGLSADVVCRVKYGEWVKRIVGGVWSVGAKRASGSRGLLAECGLSGRKCCVGQRNWRRSVVCRGEKGEWVKRPVGGFGLSGQVWRVGQENCWRSVVCRVKYGE